MKILNPQSKQLPPKENFLSILSDEYKDTPGSAEIERLLAKIDTFRKGRDKQCLLITSAVLGEGKSTVSAWIGFSSARNRNKPTLIVDFDLRRPRLHQIFNLPRRWGVADILSERLPFLSCIKRTDVANLKIMTSGLFDKNPMDIFKAQNVKRFFDEAQQYFDYIIIDSAPIIPVSDPLILGKVVDNVVIVVKAGQTSKKVIKRAIDMMLSIEANICGIIINNMNNVLPYYYDYKYYRYHYYQQDNNGKLDSVLE